MSHVPYLRSGLLATQEHLAQHAFFTRHYSENSTDYSVSAIAQALNIPTHFSLQTIQQKHTNQVLLLDHDMHKNADGIVADAIVTNQPNILIGIKTADCVPILLLDSKNKIVAAVHAGWKGALSGVIQNTLKVIANLGSTLKDVMAAIGPAIRQPSYEVGLNLYQAFTSQSLANARFFSTAYSADKYHFDLPGYCRDVLMSHGVDKCDDINLDTYSNAHMLYSYRRASLLPKDKNSAIKSRQLSVIGL